MNLHQLPAPEGINWCRKFSAIGRYPGEFDFSPNDHNTAMPHADERKIIAQLDDPGEVLDGFGVDFLFTVKFDDAGNWRSIKTQRGLDNEVEKRKKRQ
jgi:hypothetical protein